MTSHISPNKLALMGQVDFVRIVRPKKRKYFDKDTQKWTRVNDRWSVIVKCSGEHETKASFPSISAGQATCLVCKKRIIWRNPKAAREIRENLIGQGIRV